MNQQILVSAARAPSILKRYEVQLTKYQKATLKGQHGEEKRREEMVVWAFSSSPSLLLPSRDLCPNCKATKDPNLLPRVRGCHEREYIYKRYAWAHIFKHTSNTSSMSLKVLSISLNQNIISDKLEGARIVEREKGGKYIAWRKSFTPKYIDICFLSRFH